MRVLISSAVILVYLVSSSYAYCGEDTDTTQLKTKQNDDCYITVRCDVLRDLLLKAEQLERYEKAVNDTLVLLQDTEVKINELKQQNAELQDNLRSLHKTTRLQWIVFAVVSAAFYSTLILFELRSPR